MKYLHSAISLVLIAFLFIGNSIGIDVFKHICNEEGTLSVAYVVNNIDHCEDESFNVPKCCKDSKQQKDDDCCDDEIVHYSLDLDFSQDAPSFHFSHLYANFLLSNIHQVCNRDTKIEIGILNYPNPPPLKGLDILILNQVFVI